MDGALDEADEDGRSLPASMPLATLVCAVNGRAVAPLPAASFCFAVGGSVHCQARYQHLMTPSMPAVMMT